MDGDEDLLYAVQSPGFLSAAASLGGDGDEQGSERSFSSSALPGRSGKAAGPGSAAGGTATPRRFGGAEANPLLAAIRREVKASEDRLIEQVTRVERRAEQFRDAAFASVDEKFAELRGRQPEYDRKLAVMEGVVTGVQDELQSLIRRVSSMDNFVSQRRSDEANAWRSKAGELEQQLQGHGDKANSAVVEAMIGATNEKLLQLQASFDELAGGSGRLDLAEVQIERLTEAFEQRERPMDGFSQGTGSSPSMGQLLQCERTAREAEEAGEKAAREAERLSLQVRQALTQTEEQKTRMLMLIERVTQNEQQVRSVAARAALAVSEPMDSQADAPLSSRPRGPPRGLQTEVDEIKHELTNHWKGLHEVKEAVERVNEKFYKDLRLLKEAQRTISQLPPFDNESGDDSKGALANEVRALRTCIVNGEQAILRLAPKLLEAACGGKDLKFTEAVKGLQAATNAQRVGDEDGSYYEEDSQDAQSRSESRECPPPPAAAKGGKPTSCFSSCEMQ